MPMHIYLCCFSYGGVLAETVEALVTEMTAAKGLPELEVSYQRVSDDALISRSRSRAASIFQRSTKPNDNHVMFMLDHDLQWAPGDILNTCAAALDCQGIAGGIYSVRALGQGSASRASKEQVIKLGTDTLIPADYVASGFCAISASAIHKIKDALTPRIGFAPGSQLDNLKLSTCAYLDGNEFEDYFRPVVVPLASDLSKLTTAKNEYLSEDWAFCARAKAANVPMNLYARPKLVHLGQFGYTMVSAQRRSTP